MNVWSKPYIDKRKADIKALLDGKAPRTNSDRLNDILVRVQALEADNSPQGRLDRFVLIMSALVHHERYAGLSNTQVERLVDLGYALLQFQGVKPSKSQISFLFGELHLVRAQIYRNGGQHWRAAWEQQMGQHLSRNAPPGGEDFQHLSLALRALRLGYLKVAERELDQIDAVLSPTAMEQVIVARLRVLRFSQKWAELEAYRSLIDWTPLSPQAKREIEWERMCAECYTTGDLSAVASAVRRKGSHYLATYATEAKLWALSHTKTEFVSRMPKMSTIARVDALKPQRLGFLFKAALALEDAYNTNIPLIARLKTIGDMIACVSQVTTIDKELLLWTSTARWLARSKSFTLAKLALMEYASLSLRMTDGRNSDVLNLVSDLQRKPWYRS